MIFMDINKIKKNGKKAIAETLAEIEKNPFDKKTLLLLSQTFKTNTGYILGVTGPPGVGKSSLINNLIKVYRGKKKTVAVIAVDPSALLGDRIRLSTDPNDKGVFIRSMAARDKLGGLASITLSSAFVLNAIFDFTIIETVGVGQSETDIANIADTVLFCVQPGSGDSLQFMKAGIIEIPHIIAVTKSDLGDIAVNTHHDVMNSLKLGVLDENNNIPVISVSSEQNTNIKDLISLINKHKEQNGSNESRKKIKLKKSKFWLEESVKEQFGIRGIKKLKKYGINNNSPFLQYLDLFK